MRWIRGRAEGAPRGLALALGLSLGLVGLAGCSSELPAPIPAAQADGAAPRRGGVLTVATIGDVRTIDPANIGDGLAPMLLQGLLAGLVDYDEEGRLAADLAERWTLEDGGKTYRFVLRPGVRFHDGEELTAEDVKRSAERALHPSSPNPYSSYYTSLLGFDAYTSGKAEHLEGVQVEGRYVVTYRLREPDATFLPLLAMHVLRPVCRTAGARYSDAWNPCGAGPFKLAAADWDRGRQMLLTRHDGYFKPGLPYLDGYRVVFHANQTSQRFKLMRGEQDVLRDFLAPDLLRFQADARWSPFGAYETEKQIAGEAMNVEMPPFDNVEVRRAVAAAIDREKLVLVRASNLRALHGPVPQGVPGYDPAFDGQRYDYDAALEHMRRAGLAYDPVTKKGGWPHPIPYVVYKAGLQEFTAQIVAQQLEKIGLRLEIRVVNYPTFLAIRGRRRESPIGPGLWSQDYPDPLSYLEPLFHSRSINDEDSNNWSFYANPRVDELVDRARREVDEGERKRLYKDLTKIVNDEAPWAFSYTYRFYVLRQPYVRAYKPHPMWTHEVSRTWIDRGAGGPLAIRGFFSERALAALVGKRP